MNVSFMYKYWIYIECYTLCSLNSQWIRKLNLYVHGLLSVMNVSSMYVDYMYIVEYIYAVDFICCKLYVHCRLSVDCRLYVHWRLYVHCRLYCRLHVHLRLYVHCTLYRCPEDDEIMGEFEYSESKTTALVRFQVNLSNIVFA